MAADPFNELIHRLRGELLSEMPAAEVVLSAGCGGTWYFQWFDEKYPHQIVRHIGFDIAPPPPDLPPGVEWHQCSFADMSRVPDDSADLIFAGQAIEHVSAAECLSFLQHAHRILRQQGWLVMDSPNFSITGPAIYLHPEHVIEYTPKQMQAVLKAAGFRVVNCKGILLCEDNGKLLHDPFGYERIDERRITAAKERPEDSFIWWIEAVPSGQFDANSLATLLTSIERTYQRQRARFATTRHLRQAFRKGLRRLIPRRLRWLARAAFRLTTAFYARETIRHVLVITEKMATQSAQIEAQAEVMDLILRRLRGMGEDEMATHLRALQEQLAALHGAVKLVQDQAALLRTHLNASGILAPMNLKARTLQRLFQEANAHAPQEGAAVEVGCMRYPFESPQEGASTLYLARWCQQSNRKFISIDVEKDYLENARQLVTEQGLSADFILGDGTATIASLSVPIGLLYLDGSNDPNETLLQFKAAETKLTTGAVVAIDDVQQVESYLAGKGELAIPYARERGWEVRLVTTEPGFRMAVLRRPAAQQMDSKGDHAAAARE